MAFFSKLDGTSTMYSIRRDLETPVTALFAVNPTLDAMATKQYPNPKEAAAVVGLLNEALDQFKTVRIVPFRKGSEGQGFTYYTIQRIADGLYLNKFEHFTKADIDIDIITTKLFSTESDAQTKAKKLGYKIETA